MLSRYDNSPHEDDHGDEPPVTSSPAITEKEKNNQRRGEEGTRRERGEASDQQVKRDYALFTSGRATRLHRGRGNVIKAQSQARKAPTKSRRAGTYALFSFPGRFGSECQPAIDSSLGWGRIGKFRGSGRKNCSCQEVDEVRGETLLWRAGAARRNLSSPKTNGSLHIFSPSLTLTPPPILSPHPSPLPLFSQSVYGTPSFPLLLPFSLSFPLHTHSSPSFPLFLPLSPSSLLLPPDTPFPPFFSLFPLFLPLLPPSFSLLPPDTHSSPSFSSLSLFSLPHGDFVYPLSRLFLAIIPSSLLPPPFNFHFPSNFAPSLPIRKSPISPSIPPYTPCPPNLPPPAHSSPLVTKSGLIARSVRPHPERTPTKHDQGTTNYHSQQFHRGRHDHQLPGEYDCASLYGA
ncbi:hypothetical protein C7M84_000896 [Penaeus vannamei]|uniref:Uncharacterized protein n=1 Tax=Penaeus vannamei TaxID=6689 RepID=A0A3R7MLX1_PENVA|nr:hypothetical protein C7M84_000896 [Penaeus vannamei]